jgi:thiol-disulfide isomerase/thioredoxin
VLVAGCATGPGAVARGGTFEFVSPGGKTDIFYDPPASRGTVGELSGDSLTQPGTTVSLANYPNQVVVLNIWGSWCGPCRAEAPDLEFVAQQTEAAGVAMLGIDVRDDRDAARDFVRDRGLTYDSIFDQPGRVLAALSGYPRNVVPSTIVLDRQHRVAAVYLTQIRPSDLLGTVQRVAAEEPAPSTPGS